MKTRAIRWLATASIFAAATFFALLALGAHLQLVEGRELVAKGNAIEGSVIDVDISRRSTNTRMSYSYTVASGTYTRANRTIPYSEVDKVRRGTRVKVWIDPTKPDRSVTPPEMAEHESVTNRMFFPLASLALFAWGIARMLGGRVEAPVPATPVT